MPKRSLHPGNGDTKKIEQLNQAVEKMLARTDGKVGKAAAEIEPLVRIAGGRLKAFTVTRWSDFPDADFWPRITSRLFNIQRNELIPHLT